MQITSSLFFFGPLSRTAPNFFYPKYALNKKSIQFLKVSSCEFTFHSQWKKKKTKRRVSETAVWWTDCAMTDRMGGGVRSDTQSDNQEHFCPCFIFTCLARCYCYSKMLTMILSKNTHFTTFAPYHMQCSTTRLYNNAFSVLMLFDIKLYHNIVYEEKGSEYDYIRAATLLMKRQMI